MPSLDPLGDVVGIGGPNEGFGFLVVLAEVSVDSRRRLERHLAEARLPPGKTLDSFDFEAVPVISKAQVMALAAGDAWLNNGANLLLFGSPGGGKMKLPRFRGHRTIWVRGVHNGQDKSSLPA